MDYKEYVVRVYWNRIEWKNKKGELHREDGPAIVWHSGDKAWYFNGYELTEEEFKSRTGSCAGRVVEIDGKKYKLELV